MTFLVMWLSENGHVLKKTYKNDLNGRLCYLGDNSLYEKADELHSVRKKRNDYVHEPGIHCNWDELEKGIVVIEECLVSFGLAKETQELEYYSKRSALQASEDPKIAFTGRLLLWSKRG